MINGKLISQNINDKIKFCCDILKIKPSLAIVQVNDDIASNIYVQNKIKKASELGFEIKLFKENINISESLLKEKILEINEMNFSGIILQSPLPNHISYHNMISNLNYKKDVDVLSPFNIGNFFSLNKNQYKEKIITFDILDDIIAKKSFDIKNKMIVSCTPFGCLHLIKSVKNDLSGLIATVVGDSNIVGKPMSRLLLFEGCTVLNLNSKTKNIEKFLQISDIIVSATGINGLINENMLKKDQICIDVGISRNLDGKISGDFTKNCINFVDNITPVPNGVGPMTITSLLFNTFINSLKSL